MLAEARRRINHTPAKSLVSAPEDSAAAGTIIADAHQRPTQTTGLVEHSARHCWPESWKGMAASMPSGAESALGGEVGSQPYHVLGFTVTVALL